jgi:phage gp16-like protein
MNKPAPNSRISELAKIHVAKKQLGMTDEDYRAMLWTQGRVSSSKDLDQSGRQRVLDHLKACGFKPVASNKPKPSLDALPLVRRIRAQLISLERKPDEYADGIAQQMLGADAPKFFEWCQLRDLERISQALTYQQNRTGAPTK